MPWRILNGKFRSGSARTDAKALAEPVEALRLPAAWEAKPLAQLQFAAAACEAVEAGLVQRGLLEQAAATGAKDQQDNGRWKVEEELASGAPVTYGAHRRKPRRTPDSIAWATQWRDADAPQSKDRKLERRALRYGDRQIGILGRRIRRLFARANIRCAPNGAEGQRRQLRPTHLYHRVGAVIVSVYCAATVNGSE